MKLQTINTLTKLLALSAYVYAGSGPLQSAQLSRDNVGKFFDLRGSSDWKLIGLFDEGTVEPHRAACLLCDSIILYEETTVEKCDEGEALLIARQSYSKWDMGNLRSHFPRLPNRTWDLAKILAPATRDFIEIFWMQDDQLIIHAYIDYIHAVRDIDNYSDDAFWHKLSSRLKSAPHQIAHPYKIARYCGDNSRSRSGQYLFLSDPQNEAKDFVIKIDKEAQKSYTLHYVYKGKNLRIIDADRASDKEGDNPILNWGVCKFDTGEETYKPFELSISLTDDELREFDEQYAQTPNQSYANYKSSMYECCKAKSESGTNPFVHTSRSWYIRFAYRTQGGAILLEKVSCPHPYHCLSHAPEEVSVFTDPPKKSHQFLLDGQLESIIDRKMGKYLSHIVRQMQDTESLIRAIHSCVNSAIDSEWNKVRFREGDDPSLNFAEDTRITSVQARLLNLLFNDQPENIKGNRDLAELIWTKLQSAMQDGLDKERFLDSADYMFADLNYSLKVRYYFALLIAEYLGSDKSSSELVKEMMEKYRKPVDDFPPIPSKAYYNKGSTHVELFYETSGFVCISQNGSGKLIRPALDGDSVVCISHKPLNREFRDSYLYAIESEKDVVVGIPGEAGFFFSFVDFVNDNDRVSRSQMELYRDLQQDAIVGFFPRAATVTQRVIYSSNGKSYLAEAIRMNSGTLLIALGTENLLVVASRSGIMKIDLKQKASEGETEQESFKAKLAQHDMLLYAGNVRIENNPVINAVTDAIKSILFEQTTNLVYKVSIAEDQAVLAMWVLLDNEESNLNGFVHVKIFKSSQGTLGLEVTTKYGHNIHISQYAGNFLESITGQVNDTTLWYDLNRFNVEREFIEMRQTLLPEQFPRVQPAAPIQRSFLDQWEPFIIGAMLLMIVIAVVILLCVVLRVV